MVNKSVEKKSIYDICHFDLHLFWPGIRIKRAGLYVFEVHSVRQPELNLIWDYPITIGKRTKAALKSSLHPASLSFKFLN
jgi:hypothetical protein